ncbi:hypothetical protein K469DRAFT_584729, partial [Zopfia rhizophila CBS 207.26]
LYVNYKGFNKITKKNYFTLLLISKILDCLVDLIKFTKLNLNIPTTILESNIVISRKQCIIHAIAI